MGVAIKIGKQSVYGLDISYIFKGRQHRRRKMTQQILNLISHLKGVIA